MVRRIRSEDGAATVELAVIAIFLMLLITGVFEIGRALLISISLEDAAQEGAMFASFHPTDEAAIKARVIDSVDSPTLTAADVTITCLKPTSGVVGGNEIQVKVRHRMQVIVPLMPAIIGDHLNLERDSVSRAFEGECLKP